MVIIVGVLLLTCTYTIITHQLLETQFDIYHEARKGWSGNLRVKIWAKEKGTNKWEPAFGPSLPGLYKDVGIYFWGAGNMAIFYPHSMIPLVIWYLILEETLRSMGFTNAETEMVIQEIILKKRNWLVSHYVLQAYKAVVMEIHQAL